MPVDLALNAHFPTEIDGHPVTDVNSTFWLWSTCWFLGGQAAVSRALSSPPDFNLVTSSYGAAKATVDGEVVDLGAVRTPGADANSLIPYLADRSSISGSATRASIGGKNVLVWTESNGAKIYAYVSNDTLISFRNVTDSQASKVIAALP